MVALSPEIRAFLTAPRYAVLGETNADGSPHLTIVWYAPEGAGDGDDTTMFNTRRGPRKDRNLRRDGRLALCVEDGARYVTVTGTAVIEDADHAAIMADVLRLGIRYQGEAAGRALADKLRDAPRESVRFRTVMLDAHGF